MVMKTREFRMNVTDFNPDDPEHGKVLPGLSVLAGEKCETGSGRGLYDIFEETTKRFPEKMALATGEREISYRQLHSMAEIYATLFLREGIKEGDRAALTGIRNEKTIAAIYALVKLGAVYVPLDMEYPEQRIGYLIQSSGAEILIITGMPQDMPEEKMSALKKDIPGIRTIDVANIDPADPMLCADAVRTDFPGIRSDNPGIHIIFTSGTAGNPKGMLIKNNEIVNLCRWYADELKLSDTNRLYFLYSFGFDSSVKNIFASFFEGSELILGPEKLFDIDGILNIAEKYRPTHLNCVPKLINPVLNLNRTAGGSLLDELEMIVSGGEALTANAFKGCDPDSTFTVLNCYGPSECTSVNTCRPYTVRDILDGKSITIGRPIYNKFFFITDEKGEILPRGGKGEILIGGTGVIDGYINVNRPDNFMDGRYIGKIYRTGDLGYVNEDGDIEFCGRNDTQVEINGHRVELLEIRRTAEKIKGVEWFEPRLMKDKNGRENLAGFISLSEGVETENVREELKKWLPDYMVPGWLVKVESVPLTVNGKTDFDKLEKIYKDFAEDGSEATKKERKSDTKISDKKVFDIKASDKVPAGTSVEGSNVEAHVISIWKSILGRESIDRNDRFFEIGGNSLQIFEMKVKIKESMKVDLGVIDLMNAGSVCNIMDLIKRSEGSGCEQKKNTETKERVNSALNARLERMRRRRAGSDAV